MSAGAAVFMALSWATVLGWAGWSAWRVMRAGRRDEPQPRDPPLAR